MPGDTTGVNVGRHWGTVMICVSSVQAHVDERDEAVEAGDVAGISTPGTLTLKGSVCPDCTAKFLVMAGITGKWS